MANSKLDGLEVGGAYSGGSGITVSSAGVLQMNGALTVDTTSTLTGNVTAGAALTVGTTLGVTGASTLAGEVQIGGGYGSTGVTIFANGDLSLNGTLIADTFAPASLDIGGGYGSTGVSISATGNIQANGTLTIDGISTLTGTVAIGGGYGSTGITLTDAGVLSVDGITKLGAGANYTSFDATGHQTMAGTAKPWEDLRVEPSVRGTKAENPVFEQYFDDSGPGDTGTSVGVYLYDFTKETATNEKEVFFSAQMPHAWDGKPFEFHVHWTPKASELTANVAWALEYTWIDIGGVFAGTDELTGATIMPAVTDLVVGTHYITELGTLTPDVGTQDGLSTILICRLYRDSADAADTYTDDVGLLYADFHYQLSSIGSDQEYVK
jgi:hypothetical protein